MAKAVDVAEYILSQAGPMTAMKLQKLVYYSQAWHLAWTEKPLFREKIEAWCDGPVVPALYKFHKGVFKLAPGFFKKQLKGKPARQLTDDEKDIVNRIIKYYGKRDPHWLSQLTHMEDPWKNARSAHGVADLDRSSAKISPQSMFEYYSVL